MIGVHVSVEDPDDLQPSGRGEVSIDLRGYYRVDDEGLSPRGHDVREASLARPANLNDFDTAVEGKDRQVPGQGPRLHPSRKRVRLHSLRAQTRGRELACPPPFADHDDRPSGGKVQRLEGSIVAALTA